MQHAMMKVHGASLRTVEVGQGTPLPLLHGWPEYFLRHWAHRKDAFDDVLDAFVDNFHKPGNLTGGFAHYRASHAGRIAMMKSELPAMPRIADPRRHPGYGAVTNAAGAAVGASAHG